MGEGSAGLWPECQPGRYVYGDAAELQLCPTRLSWRQSNKSVLDEPASSVNCDLFSPGYVLTLMSSMPIVETRERAHLRSAVLDAQEGRTSMKLCYEVVAATRAAMALEVRSTGTRSIIFEKLCTTCWTRASP